MKNFTVKKQTLFAFLISFICSFNIYADKLIFEGAMSSNGQNMTGTHRIQLGFLKPDSTSTNGYTQNANFTKDLIFSSQGDFIFELTQQEINDNSLALIEATKFQFTQVNDSGIPTAQTNPVDILLAQKAHFSNISAVANTLESNYESSFLKKDTNNNYTITDNQTLVIGTASLRINTNSDTPLTISNINNNQFASDNNGTLSIQDQNYLKQNNNIYSIQSNEFLNLSEGTLTLKKADDSTVNIKKLGSNFNVNSEGILSVQSVTQVDQATSADSLEGSYEATFLRSNQDDIFGQDSAGSNVNKTLTIAQGSNLFIDGTLKIKNNADTPATYDIQNLEATHFNLNGNTLQIKDDAITTAKIDNNAITNDHITANANISLSKIDTEALFVKDSDGHIDELILNTSKETPFQIHFQNLTPALEISNTNRTFTINQELSLKFNTSGSNSDLTIRGEGSGVGFENIDKPFFSLLTYKQFANSALPQSITDPTEFYISHKGLTMMQSTKETTVLEDSMQIATEINNANIVNNYKLINFTHLSDSFESVTLNRTYSNSSESLNWSELNVTSIKSEKSLQTADATESKLAIKGLADHNDPNRYTVSALQVIHLINHLEGYVPLLYLPEGSNTVSYTLQNGQTITGSPDNGFSFNGSTVTFNKPSGSTDKIFTTTATINLSQDDARVNITVVIP